MGFFRTTEGRFHTGRFGLVVYFLGSSYGFWAHRMDLHCWLWVLVLAGWCIATCRKVPAKTLLGSSLVEKFGFLLVLLSAAAQIFLPTAPAG